MNPLHDYVAGQVAEKLKSRKVVVWYDARKEFAPFIAELRGGVHPGREAVQVKVEGIEARLAEFTGSMFELRAIVEPYVSADVPDFVVLYLPGCERDRRNSVLMELEKAGDCYEPQLKRLARNVLRHRYTDGAIDEMLASERVSYGDLARACSDTSPAGPPSLLKAIYHDTNSNEGLLAAWLASDARDAEIANKEVAPELRKLIQSKLGLELPDEAPLAKLRSITARYVLAAEFRSDLSCPPPASLESVPQPNKKEEVNANRDLARTLRLSFPGVYAAMADRVESELGLQQARVPAERLGSIDTFRFEEKALLSHCGELIAAKRFDDALTIVKEREHSFWLDRDVARRAQWEACRRMAELGKQCDITAATVAKIGTDPKSWIDAYTVKGGLFQLDQSQRRLESWIANLDDDPQEHPLAVVRSAYERASGAMAEGFSRALERANWSISTTLHQTQIYSAIVIGTPKPVAYFLVDAMRFEMGMELSERLPDTIEMSLRPALGSLPSITPIGMAALQPGASSSFDVVEQKGTLGARIDDTFLPDLTARRKFASSRVPQLVDMSLDELLSLQPSRLAKKIDGAQVIVVRSQEIDHAGEAGFTFQARQVMDTVVDNLARGVRKLAAAGIDHAVITADHGHLFFPVDRDESMRIEAPGGDEVELHRRCWIGRGGATPAGCIRVSAAALGYDSDLDFVFPAGTGIFKAGGDLAYHHGGPSLQELVLPVLTVRVKSTASVRKTAGPITATGFPEAITNRIFSVAIQFDAKNLSLFSKELLVRPLLVAAGKKVGGAGMAIDAELDRTTGCVKLHAGKPVAIAFLLNDETVASVRVVIQDPTTDAELYRSPNEIPVRFGV